MNDLKWDDEWQFKSKWGLVYFIFLKTIIFSSLIPVLLGILFLVENKIIPNCCIPYPFDQVWMMFILLGLWVLSSFIITVKVSKKYNLLIKRGTK